MSRLIWYSNKYTVKLGFNDHVYNNFTNQICKTLLSQIVSLVHGYNDLTV